MLDLYVLKLEIFNIYYTIYLLDPTVFCNVSIQ